MPVPDNVMWCLHSNTIQNLIGQLQGINCRSALVQSTIFVEPLTTSGLRSNYAAFFSQMFDIVFFVVNCKIMNYLTVYALCNSANYTCIVGREIIASLIFHIFNLR